MTVVANAQEMISAIRRAALTDPSVDTRAVLYEAALYIEHVSGIARRLDERTRELTEAREHTREDERLIAERDRILDALPCPTHGRCIPYVLERIRGLSMKACPLPPRRTLLTDAKQDPKTVPETSLNEKGASKAPINPTVQ